MKIESLVMRQPLLFRLIFFISASAFAQSVQISKDPNFSTADNTFTFNETLYARVTAPQIDYTELDKNEFRLKAATLSDDVKGAFDNLFNGTYTTAIGLSSLNRSERDWEFRVELKDKRGNEFKTRVNLAIQDNTPPPVVTLTGPIEALAGNSLTISKKIIFVDAATKVTEIGQALKFSDLRLNWKVDVRAEKRADSLLWALTIDVLERVANTEVEAEGRLANLQDSVMIVNDIKFRAIKTTILQNQNGALIDLSDFRVGMAVEARGGTDPAGKIIAQMIKIEDENFVNQEIQFTGVVDSLLLQPPPPNSIRVNGDRFEVNAQTELRGFNDEPIFLANLQRGETVEIKARTRQNLPALALRIKREKPAGDVQVKGRIERLNDSSLVVSGVEFLRSRTTLVLDDESLVIPFSALSAGLMVEVRANRLTTGRLAAAFIKVEDEANDEVELTGFVEALSDTTIRVSSAVFLVNAATVVLDQNAVRIAFSALQVRMLVEIRGERRFNGSVLAKEIRIEDFLLQNEVELRGSIAAINSNSVRVADVDFSVDDKTMILDLNGAPIPLSRLTAGTIVEIRAKSSGGVWQASRLKIENEIDTEIVVIGAIDSLRTNTFYMLRRLMRGATSTIYLGLNNEPLSLSNLRTNDVVEVLGRLLPDSSLIALRVKKQNRGTNEVEARGQITRRGPSTLAVASFTFALDGATRFFDAENRPIALADLRDGQIAMAEGIRQTGGLLRANLIRLQNHRVLTGVISNFASGIVTIAGLQQIIGPQSYFVDEQNRPISANEIKVQQQVRVVANAASSRWEILNLRILFRTSNTVVESSQSPLPKHFVLHQNFPNPFAGDGLATNALTVIRFILPQQEDVALTVYNQLGQKIRTIVTGRFSAGLHEHVWNGRDDAGAKVASGIYFYRLQAGQYAATRRIMVLR